MARIHWLEPGVLGGGPHPGEGEELRRSIDELRAEHVGAIVTLTERPLEQIHLVTLHLPTPDGEAPEDLEAICAQVETTRRAGLGTFVHCHAGIGRTGTALAAWVIWSRGLRAIDAVDEVRARYHRFAVETEAQLGALTAFERRHKLL